MLPREAAEHDPGSAGVLTESFTQEVWASVFRQLVDHWKDGTLGGRESVYVAALPGTKATPMRSAIKRTGSRFRTGSACEFPFMSSARPELSPLRLPRGEIVFYPTRRPSIRVLSGAQSLLFRSK